MFALGGTGINSSKNYFLESFVPDRFRFEVRAFVAALQCAYGVAATAQSLPSTTGTLITLSANGEVRHANDQASASLRLEEQDKDRSAAVSRLNQKMKQGIALVKRDDASALLTTRGYVTTPVYADAPQKPDGKLRQVIGWRVSQSLEVVTTNLAGLPTTIADAQSLFALQGLSFSLSESATRLLDDERIQTTYRNLLARIASVAKSMGRSSAEATIESLDVDTPAGYAFQQKSAMPMAMMRNASEATAIESPNFEAGETALSLQMNAKVRLK